MRSLLLHSKFSAILLLIIALAAIGANGQSPGGVTGMSQWYLNTNATATQWTDASPNGNHVPVNSAAPTLAKFINFNPVATFNGSNQRYTRTAALSNGITVNGGATSFYVASTSLTSASYSVVHSQGFVYGLNSGRYSTRLHGGSVDGNYVHDATIANAWEMNQPILVRSGFNAGATNNSYISKNSGTEVPSANTIARTLTTEFSLGASYNGAGYLWNGDIAEVIVYPTKLVSSDYTKVESYLALKYGITKDGDYLASTGTAVWSSSSNSGYNSNIAGLINDGTSGLNQKQSVSQNAGSQLLIATTGVANSNALNANSLTAGQALVWGDNGLEKQPVVSIAGISGINYRFASKWKIQNTGTVGTVRVLWPTGLSNLKLIQSSDSDFDANDVVTDMTNTQTINGVNYNYADVTLADGQYITLAAYVFTPGGVIGFAAWYKGNAGLSSATWEDQSFNGYNLTGNNSPSVSTYLNFNKVASLNGTNQTYNNSAVKSNWPIGTSAVTYYYVAKQADNANTIKTVLGIYGDLGFYSGRVGTTANIGGSLYSTNESTYGAVATTTTWNTNPTNLVRTGRNGTASNLVFLSANGDAAVSSTNSNNFAYTNSSFRIGGTPAGTQEWNGQIAEVIVYPGVHTPTNYNKVESYLALKYGISKSGDYLTSSETTVWSSSLNAGYNNNIAGVVRDIPSGLDQKQSMSQNKGSQILIATAGISNTNDANTTSLTDGQALIWGDNGMEKAFTESLLHETAPGGKVNYRFGSIWKVQNTGNVGDVVVAWPAGTDNLHLVKSADGTIDPTDTFVPLTSLVNINGVDYATATVTLQNGEYFTIAGYLCAPGGITSKLRVWLKADNGFSPGSWTDFSGNGNHYTQTNSGRQPSVVNGTPASNFNPTIDFGLSAANAKFMVVPSGKPYSADGLDNSMFLVVQKKPGVTSYADYLGFGSTTTGTTLIQANEPVLTNYGSDRVSLYPYLYGEPVQTFTADGLHHITDVSYTVGESPLKYGLDGKEAQRNDVVTATYSKTASGSILGSQVEESFSYMQEVIAFERDLSAIEKQRIRSYLAVKYGITLSQPQNYLSSTGSTVWNSATNTSFNNNIFGLANDESSCLNQKISNSINEGVILKVATTNDFASVNSESGRTSLSSNNQYLLIGDNGISTYTDDDIDCPALNDPTNVRKLDRTWLVQQSGSAGAVFLQFDLSAYSIKSEAFLWVADDAGMTTNSSFIPATSINGTTAVFYADLKNGQYFTVIGKIAIPNCTSCVNGEQVLKNGKIWFDGGASARSGNIVSNVPLTGNTPESGALSADVTVTYPAGVEYIPNSFPLWAGNRVLLNRYDNVSGEASKVTYDVKLKDASGNISAKTSFQISGIMKYLKNTTKIRVIGYCGGEIVRPKLSYGYNSTPSLNAALRSFTIDQANSTATGTKIGGYLASYSTLNVNFEKSVENVVIEWIEDSEYTFNTLTYLYISDMTFTCDFVPEPAPDNVHLIATILEDELKTCEEATIKLEFSNNNCDSKQINLANSLPAGLEFVPDSYVAIDQEAPTYSGQSFSLNNLVLQPGISYAYIKVKTTNPTVSASYETQFTYTVQGGVNIPNPYLSDGNVTEAGYQQTEFAYTAVVVEALPELTTTVANELSNNTEYLPSTTNPGETLVYTYTFNNTSGATVSGLELTDQVSDLAVYLPGSIVSSTGVTFTSNSYGNAGEEKLLFLQGLSLPTGISTITVRVSVGMSEGNIESGVVYSKGPSDPCAAGGGEVLAMTLVTPADCFRGGYLIPQNNLYTQLLTDNCEKDGWIYYIDEDKRTVLAVRPNGNTWLPDNVLIDTQPFSNTQTNGVDKATILTRLFTIKHTGALTNPVDVRLYYSESELQAAVPLAEYPTQGWFKHSGFKTDVEGDLTATGLSGGNAILLAPSATGTEFGLSYVQFNGLTTFSTIGYTGNNSDSVLPVDLISFSAEKVEQSVELNWKTASEINNKGFEVEQSTNARTWRVIGFVPAVDVENGKSGLYSYKFKDIAPAEAVNYYRLKQVELDGKFVYSHFVSVDMSPKDRNSSFILYPNPVVGGKIKLDTKKSGAKRVKIYNTAGVKLVEVKFNGVMGSVDVHTLPAGHYILELMFENGVTESRSFLKE